MKFPIDTREPFSKEIKLVEFPNLMVNLKEKEKLLKEVKILKLEKKKLEKKKLLLKKGKKLLKKEEDITDSTKELSKRLLTKPLKKLPIKLPKSTIEDDQFYDFKFN